MILLITMLITCDNFQTVFYNFILKCGTSGYRNIATKRQNKLTLRFNHVINREKWSYQ